MTDQTTTVDAPWHAAYPSPQCTKPASLTRSEVLELFRSGKKAGKDFVLVDLRRMDHEGGTIRGSINLPAQSLYPSIPTLYALVAQGKTEKVIWYCGSSRGRGTRAAGWFDDYIRGMGDEMMKSYTLAEGITGWANAGREYVALMDEYDAEVWEKKAGQM